MENYTNVTSSNIFTDVYNYYLWTLTIADRRTQGWLMVDSPAPTLIYTALYLILVGIGPKFMKPRKPLSLRGTLVLYNIFMAGLNLYIALELLIASTRLQYSYVCQPMTYINNKEELRVANGLWWYYFSKLLEFCDTLFFILRKKEEQLTFLHVYHHSTMFSLWWIGIKWVPSGSSFLPAMVNSFVHVLMYSYYALAALGPKVTPYLWWKKYLTIIQLVQFSTALLMGINGIRRGCDFPLWMQYALVAYMMSFILLFGKFYAKAYLKKGQEVLSRQSKSKLDQRDTDVESKDDFGGTCLLEVSRSTHRSANGSSNGFANGKHLKTQ